MRASVQRAATRLTFTALLYVGACSNVLGIDSPVARGIGGDSQTGEAGQSGDSAAGATSNGGVGPTGGGTQTGAGGVAGESGVGGKGGPAGATNTAGEAGAASEAGTGGAPSACKPKELRCDVERPTYPQVCAASGWVANPNENRGEECPVLCREGRCVECSEGDKRCSVCQEGDPQCSQRMPQTCVGGKWQDATRACDTFCSSGECGTPPSCAPSLGQSEACPGSASCCRSLLVPGGHFLRRYDGSEYYNDDSHPADVSSFLLDKFEVTVGRMRAFVTAYETFKASTLKSGYGKSVRLNTDTGWDTGNTLPATAAELKDMLRCPGATWLDDTASNPAANDRLPINCVNFNVAYAFCLWDGGRLPTETEWNYTAAGGGQQRVFPWVAPLEGDPVSPEYAQYYVEASSAPITVGSKPLGDGRWGQSDLAGNVLEWNLDYFADFPDGLCKDCVYLMPTGYRMANGGSFATSPPDYLVNSFRGFYYPPTQVQSVSGIRCARDINLPKD